MLLYLSHMRGAKAQTSMCFRMRGSRKICQRGSNFNNVFCLFVFLVDKGREDPNTTISEPSSARQRLAGVPMIS